MAMPAPFSPISIKRFYKEKDLVASAEVTKLRSYNTSAATMVRAKNPRHLKGKTASSPKLQAASNTDLPLAGSIVRHYEVTAFNH